MASDKLAAAEEWARWAAVHDDWDKTQELMGVLLEEYDRRGAAEAENKHGWDVSHKFAEDMCERVRGAEAERDRLRVFLLEATGTLPAYGFADNELGDPWVRWAERVAAYLTETHR